MNILERIIARKREEVAAAKAARSVASLEASPMFSRPTLSLQGRLLAPEGTGIIAEFKRRSPSKGLLNGSARVEDVTAAYAEGGAAGISVLTDTDFFGGSLDDLQAARPCAVPLLRKDFVIDEYQLLEARASGADVVLLIAACLSPAEVQTLARTARGLGLEVLLEVHDESELRHICPEVSMIGVNNRDLKTFQVSIDTSLRLIPHFPKEVPAVSESGISAVETILTLRAAGYRGFLIGEQFMRSEDPAAGFAAFVQELRRSSCA